MGRKRKPVEAGAAAEAAAPEPPAPPNVVAGAPALLARAAAAGSQEAINAAAAAAAARAAGLRGVAAQTLMNPNMAALIAANPLLAGQLAQFAGAAAMPTPDSDINPDVREFADHFRLDERITKRLNDTMKLRQETFEGDMIALYENLETARHPPGLLSVKLKEMEEGVFLGKGKPDPDVQELAAKYKLDDQASRKLSEVLKMRPATRENDIIKIGEHLEGSTRPSAMVMTMLSRLRAGESLGAVPPPVPKPTVSFFERQKESERSGGVGGSGGDRGSGDRGGGDRGGGDRSGGDRRSGGTSAADRDRERDRDRDRGRRSRSYDRDRRRSRSRSRDRRRRSRS